MYYDILFEESLSRYDWPVADEATEDYEELLKQLKACAERVLKPRQTHLERISNATKEMLRRRRALRLDPNASHVERLIANVSCRRISESTGNEEFKEGLVSRNAGGTPKNIMFR